MALQLHNLLVSEEKRKVRMLYRMRVLVVGAALCGLAVLFGTVALIPTYALLSSELAEIRDDIARHEVGADDRDVIEREVAQVRALLTKFTLFPQDEHVIEHLARVLVEKPDSVQIRGLAYEHEGDTLVLEGVARTRTDLVGYTAALEAREGIERVILPIANLARNNDVPFSITITLASSSPQTSTP